MRILKLRRRKKKYRKYFNKIKLICRGSSRRIIKIFLKSLFKKIKRKLKKLRMLMKRVSLRKEISKWNKVRKSRNKKRLKRSLNRKKKLWKRKRNQMRLFNLLSKNRLKALHCCWINCFRYLTWKKAKK